MQRLSATGAISPAWHHVRKLLWTPPNWRNLLKIGAVAVFSQISGCSFSGKLPPGASNHATPPVQAAMAVALLGIGLLLIAVALGMFYLSSRLQFVLFEAVLKQETVIAPIWRRYGRVTWRWIGLKVAFLLAVLICAAPVLVPVVLHFVRSIPAFGAGQATAVPFFFTILTFIAAIFCLVLLITAAYWLLLDFGLPSMALEDAGIGETLRRLWSLLSAEPAQTLFYLFMKFLLAIAGAIANYFTLIASTLILLIPLGGASIGLWLGLRHSGIVGHLLMVGGWIVAGLILLAAMAGVGIIAFGFLLTFLQAYAIYFLGGRYPLLGEILDPTPGRPFTPPPPLRGPDEPDDDDGPAFPMDPVPA
jgi:hypothetical protein